MANQVIYTNLYSESRNNVVEIITNNVSDPISATGASRKWIYSRVPDIKSSDFKGYPFIVVPSSTVSVPKENSSADGKSKDVSWFIEVEIFSSDRGYGDNNSMGLAHMDSISDDLTAAFLSLTNRAILSANGMSFSMPDSEPAEVVPLKHELVYSRTIVLNFSKRMQVSA